MVERRAIVVRGVVQGVGFRPFVYSIAKRLRLAGMVRNEVGNVLVEVEGERGDIEEFMRELADRPPALARVERVDWRIQTPLGESRFRIEASAPGESSGVLICPDIATCDDCLRELLDPRDRRYRYPFINCTNCGPRLTIVRGAPYDRQRTTMSGFKMCDDCRGEYDDPTDRRFHAQPIACGVCGPRLSLLDERGGVVVTDDPLREVVAGLRAGKIAAIKGLGGYHLACDAGNSAAVSELRRRKHRDEKPFAVMLADVAAAEGLCEVTAGEARLLISAQRPVVLLRKGEGVGLAGDVAPGNPWLGVMLPYTPVHHLLMRDLAGMPLVMTSGNRTDEPIVHDDAEVVRKLGGIADVFVTHDRPINVRCDDSVTRVVGAVESPIRRSRGYVPQPIRLPVECPAPLLAVGGQMKDTFALGRGRHAILSHHLGDLDDLRAYAAFERDIRLFAELFGAEPRWLVHDLHPDYASTRYARQRQDRDGIPCVAVQHHHAHVASCMAEHGLNEPVIGVSFDGTGFGTDGAIWGGEFLVGDLRSFRRAAHLRYVPLPGGEWAVREPWRMALSHLDDAGIESRALRGRVGAAAVRTARRMIERQFNAPPTSSAGRLFDAVASLVGVRDRVSFEGQAAMQLEGLATGVCDGGVYAFDFALPSETEAAIAVDTRPLIREVVADVERGVAPRVVARRFHRTMAALIAATCRRIREQTGLYKVVLSGGVFMNALLVGDTEELLKASGFSTVRNRAVPPNDGGLSLGQLAVAAAQLSWNAEAGR